jgi:hypothetical protein
MSVWLRLTAIDEQPQEIAAHCVQPNVRDGFMRRLKGRLAASSHCLASVMLFCVGYWSEENPNFYGELGIDA